MNESTPAPAPAPVQVLLPSYRYPSPTAFNGVRDGFACEAWLTTVRRFFIGARISEDSRTVTAVAYLGPTGLLWWDGLQAPDTTPWFQFEELFRAEFRPAGFYDHVRTLLFGIKMSSTVADYVSRTRRYLAILCTNETHPEARIMLEDSAKSCFLAGAPLALRQMLMSLAINSRSPVSIHEMCQAAEQFDTIYNFSLPNRTPTNANHATPTPAHAFLTAHTASLPDPMAMELDNLRLELNALRRQVNNNNGRHNLAPLNDTERARLRARGACYKCRQDGHMARDCRGSNMNNLSVAAGVGSASAGNASSDQA
ncbi:hypothetical protein BGZ54_001826 [Gamsiella multidivaricata]|nr:hypothetical protein BGZ54_001826 [Gamsiella multidivaricata]